MKYYLENRNIRMTVTDFGCRIMELQVPDRDGKYGDIVLGAKDEQAYMDYGRGERFLGATIGRFANRIARGQFQLDGKSYQLECNNGQNALHGGVTGFDMLEWQVLSHSGSRIDFYLESPDGDQGYPGNMKVWMSYELSADSLIISYKANCDRKTVINLTHHSFFNLRGEGNGTVNEHLMYINADNFTPVDETLIPTGQICPVAGTPFDFRTPSVIGDKLDFSNKQIQLGGGFDHNWVLNKRCEGELSLAARVYEPESGRVLEVLTTEPGMQFYGGNYFDGTMVGKNGKPYIRNCSFALETQHFPDSPNHASFPSTVLEPGSEYNQICIYRFSTR